MSPHNQKVIKVQPRSGKTIERKAEQLNGLLPGFTRDKPISLDVFGLCESLDDVGLISFGVDELENGEEGKYDPVRNQLLISLGTFLNFGLCLPRPRFTIAHELGHWVLHRKQMLKVYNGETQCEQVMPNEIPAFENPEWQANRFAGALLMPRELVLQVVEQTNCERDELVALLGETFATSRAAVERRLKTLGI